jgi:hypothetical protein
MNARDPASAEARKVWLLMSDLVVDNARRRPHPTDGRAKVVEATGTAPARRADAILATPPPPLGDLGPDDVATLRRILESVVTP